MTLEKKPGSGGQMGGIDGDVGRGVPIPGRSRKKETDGPELEPLGDIDDFDLEHDDAEPNDRRRDPLRKP